MLQGPLSTIGVKARAEAIHHLLLLRSPLLASIITYYEYSFHGFSVFYTLRPASMMFVLSLTKRETSSFGGCISTFYISERHHLARRRQTTHNTHH